LVWSGATPPKQSQAAHPQQTYRRRLRNKAYITYDYIVSVGLAAEPMVKTHADTRVVGWDLEIPCHGLPDPIAEQ
jgi:hypothetical protein